MLRFLSALAFLCLATLPAQAEEPDHADGLTISDYLDGAALDQDMAPKYSNRLTNAFSTTNSSSTVTVTDTAHTRAVGAKIIVDDTATTVGGLNMDGVWTVATVTDANTYTFTHTGTASSTVTNGGGATLLTYPGFPTNGVLLPGAGDEIKLRFLCEPSHVSYDDPIVFPGQANATHLHMFFGNTLTNANSTYQSLRTTGNGSCQGGPLNRTGYWFPAMIKTTTNQVIWPYHIQFYYVGARADLREYESPACSCGGAGEGRYACSAARDLMACPMLPIQDFERGMVGIHGYKLSAPAGRAQGSANWSCVINDVVQVGNKSVLYDPATPSNGIESCGDQGEANVNIRQSFFSARCWDGTYGMDNDHYSHFADDENDQYGEFNACPATHPRRLISLHLFIDWPVDTTSAAGVEDYKHWKLSSDFFNGATYRAGETFHFDSFWAWNRTLQTHIHQKIHGMYPTMRTPPYLYDSLGDNVVGGKYVQALQGGGLGNDCSTLGIAGPCTLKFSVPGFTISAAWANVRTAVPAGSSRRGRGKGRMR
jgi:hypothetical protein